MTSKELSQKIISLTHAYMREVEEFIRARDMAGMHACEERWREEVESVCIESVREIQAVVMPIKADMREILSSLDKPTTKPEEWQKESSGPPLAGLGSAITDPFKPRLMARPSDVHTCCAECAITGCLEVKQ